MTKLTNKQPIFVDSPLVTVHLPLHPDHLQVMGEQTMTGNGPVVRDGRERANDAAPDEQGKVKPILRIPFRGYRRYVCQRKRKSAGTQRAKIRGELTPALHGSPRIGPPHARESGPLDDESHSWLQSER